MTGKRVGVIVEVNDQFSKVGVYSLLNDLNVIWDGEILSGIKVGAYLTINQNDVKIIATVSSEKVIDQQNCIQLLKPGIHHIYNQEYYYFSLFALNESILSISQAEYILDHYLLKRDDPLCVSNEVKGEYTIIENNENIILVRSRDAK